MQLNPEPKAETPFETYILTKLTNIDEDLGRISSSLLKIQVEWDLLKKAIAVSLILISSKLGIDLSLILTG